MFVANSFGKQVRLAAPLHDKTRCLQQGGYGIKPLRVAGHDHPLHGLALRGSQGLQRLYPQGFFAVAAAGQQGRGAGRGLLSLPLLA